MARGCEDGGQSALVRQPPGESPFEPALAPETPELPAAPESLRRPAPLAPPLAKPLPPPAASASAAPFPLAAPNPELDVPVVLEQAPTPESASAKRNCGRA